MYAHGAVRDVFVHEGEESRKALRFEERHGRVYQVEIEMVAAFQKQIVRMRVGQRFFGIRDRATMARLLAGMDDG